MLKNFSISHFIIIIISLYLIYILIRVQNNQKNIKLREYFDQNKLDNLMHYVMKKDYKMDWINSNIPITITCPNPKDMLLDFEIELKDNDTGIIIGKSGVNLYDKEGINKKVVSQITNTYTFDGNLSNIPSHGDLFPEYKNKSYRLIKIGYYTECDIEYTTSDKGCQKCNSGYLRNMYNTCSNIYYLPNITVNENSSYIIKGNSTRDIILSFVVTVIKNNDEKTNYTITPGTYGFPTGIVTEYKFVAKVGGSNPIPDKYHGYKKLFYINKIKMLRNFLPF